MKASRMIHGPHGLQCSPKHPIMQLITNRDHRPPILIDAPRPLSFVPIPATLPTEILQILHRQTPNPAELHAYFDFFFSPPSHPLRWEAEARTASLRYLAAV